MSKNRSKAWWIYFYLLLVSIIATPISDPPNSVVAWSQLLVASVGLVGLYGFIRSKKIGLCNLWRSYFVIFIIVACISSVSAVFNSGTEAAFQRAGVFIGMVLNLPLLIALWEYAFRSPHLWSTTMDHS